MVSFLQVKKQHALWQVYILSLKICPKFVFWMQVQAQAYCPVRF